LPDLSPVSIRLALLFLLLPIVAAMPPKKMVAHDLKSDWQRIGPCFGPVLVVFGFGCHWLASSPRTMPG
ncbi:MAG: hypothetical protein WBZ51_37945, partial [Xanthobacteraceae bacterium]